MQFVESARQLAGIEADAIKLRQDEALGVKSPTVTIGAIVPTFPKAAVSLFSCRVEQLNNPNNRISYRESRHLVALSYPFLSSMFQKIT